jgi:uncharacterized protein YlxP (DUF503 family)
MSLGILTLHFLLPGCTSLKAKRGRLKPILARLHRQFNLSAAEIDLQDHWHEAIIACALISNDPTFTRRALQQALEDTLQTWPDLTLLEDHLELL